MSNNNVKKETKELEDFSIKEIKKLLNDLGIQLDENAINLLKYLEYK